MSLKHPFHESRCNIFYCDRSVPPMAAYRPHTKPFSHKASRDTKVLLLDVHKCANRSHRLPCKLQKGYGVVLYGKPDENQAVSNQRTEAFD